MCEHAYVRSHLSPGMDCQFSLTLLIADFAGHVNHTENTREAPGFFLV